MNLDQIISDITSGDVAKIRTATSKIISFSQDKEKVLLLLPFKQLIIDKTSGLEMGGAFAPNKRFVDYVLNIIDFHASDQRCPCTLYSDFKYEGNDPNAEASKRNIKINEIVKSTEPWIDYYSCSCFKCGQKFKTYERDGHYTCWEWVKAFTPTNHDQLSDIHTSEKTTDIETQKQGYYELINLCAGDAKKELLTNFINSLQDYNGDENFCTTLNYVKDFLDINGHHLIMALDWKQEIRDLNWRINSSLNDNFQTKINLPNPETYGSRASVSSKNVFSDYDAALRSKNFQIGFIDTNSDEYVIVIHQTEDQNKVEEAFKKIGYPYLDAKSPKINNEA